MEKQEWSRVSAELARIIGGWVENCVPERAQEFLQDEVGGQLLVNVMDFLERDGKYQ